MPELPSLVEKEVILAEIASSALHLVYDAVVIADMRERDTPLLWVSDQFSTITGYSPAEAVGKNCRYLQGNDRLQPELSAIRNAFRDGTGVTVTLRNYRKDGTLFWNELTLAPHPGPDGKAAYYIGIIRDVTAAKGNLDQASYNASNDRLTNLPNRSSFLDNVEAIEIPDGCHLLIIKLDIAGLHNINSTYGYAAGDELICKVAARLQALDPRVLGRIGSNEFAMAFSLPAEMDESATLAKVTTCLRAPFTVGDAIIATRFALGYTIGGPGEAPALLTQQAGHALHESKGDPRRAARRFDASEARLSRFRSQLAAELQHAVRDDNFIYFYQPQFDLHTNEIVGIEGLLRWQHPVFGLQAPDTFIGIAEETGLIIDIERAGIRKVAALARRVNERRETPLCFSVNVSPLEIVHGNMEYLLDDVVRQTGVDPSWLTLELTESLLTDQADDVVELFARLRTRGFGLAIDDFGTGYSSLRSIARFPISEIKIDRTFTQDLQISGTKRIMVEAILSLGGELKARIVAEGIETPEQQTYLREMGCRIGQGFLFSRPLSERDLLDLLNAQER